jgi:hypothetical protein
MTACVPHKLTPACVPVSKRVSESLRYFDHSALGKAMGNRGGCLHRIAPGKRLARSPSIAPAFAFARLPNVGALRNRDLPPLIGATGRATRA